jgi:microcystin-dependent protein
MPTTYSANLGISLMADGEDSGTWGDITNANLGTLLEESIIGSATVAMADANQTISITNGATSSGRKLYIKCTGVDTAQRNLTVPTSLKQYIVNNATTGGFGINVTTSGGTGIVVPNGTVKILYVDGTNVLDAVTGLGNISTGTINGNTITAGTGTLTLSGGKTLTNQNNLTLAGVDGQTFYLPPGLVLPFAGTGAAAAGWLYCDGASYATATYPNLFAAIGYTFGGSGANFNTPDMRGRVAAGMDIINGSADSGRLNLYGGVNTLGTAIGAQSNTASTTVSGTAFTNGLGGTAFTNGLGVSGNAHGYEGGTIYDAAGNTGASIIGTDVTLAVSGTVVGNSSISVSGNSTVSASGTSGAFGIVMPTMVMNFIIKT